MNKWSFSKPSTSSHSTPFRKQASISIPIPISIPIANEPINPTSFPQNKKQKQKQKQKYYRNLLWEYHIISNPPTHLTQPT